MKPLSPDPGRWSPQDRARLIVDMIHRLVLHHGMWYGEVRHQLGQQQALELLGQVVEKSLAVQLRRIGKLLGLEMNDGLPEPLVQMDADRQRQVMEAVAANWLANDGIWFQAVEFSHGMNDAKRCNDSCWAQFSPAEAACIRKLAGLGPRPGLQGLAQALQLRLYSVLNKQTIRMEQPDVLVFEMNRCRVQEARRRKGLDDYPCKSAGLVEYTYFARAIDERIRTECVGCPPDPHPEQWFCAWRFTIETRRQAAAGRETSVP